MTMLESLTNSIYHYIYWCCVVLCWYFSSIFLFGSCAKRAKDASLINEHLEGNHGRSSIAIVKSKIKHSEEIKSTPPSRVKSKASDTVKGDVAKCDIVKEKDTVVTKEPAVPLKDIPLKVVHSISDPRDNTYESLIIKDAKPKAYKPKRAPGPVFPQVIETNESVASAFQNLDECYLAKSKRRASDGYTSTVEGPFQCIDDIVLRKQKSTYDPIQRTQIFTLAIEKSHKRGSKDSCVSKINPKFQTINPSEAFTLNKTKQTSAVSLLKPPKGVDGGNKGQPNESNLKLPKKKSKTKADKEKNKKGENLKPKSMTAIVS